MALPIQGWVRHRPPGLRLASLATLLLAAAACGSPPSAGSGAFPDAGARRSSASPLREVATSAEEAEFTSITHLAVDSRGRVYVADFYRNGVTVLGADGRLLRTIGRRGSGPDEFRAIRSVQVLPGDSLLVYDGTLARIGVYAPDSARAAYAVSLGGRLGGPAPWHLRRTPANDGLLALFRPEFAFVPGADFGARRDEVRLLALDGTPAANLASFPSKAFLVAGTSVMPHPFGREGFAEPDSRGILHLVWSDTLAAAAVDLRGRPAGGFRVPYDAPAMAPAAGDDFLRGMPAQVAASFGPVLADSMPARWPAVSGFLVDDRDRLWFGLAGPPDEPVEWAAFTPAGGYLGSFVAPAGTVVRAIRAPGTVYAERRDADGVPRLVVLEMARPLP